MVNLIPGNYKEAEKAADTWLAKNSSVKNLPPDHNFFWLLPDRVFLDARTGNAACYRMDVLNELKPGGRQAHQYYDDLYDGSGVFNYHSQFFSQMAFAFLSTDTGILPTTMEGNRDPLKKNDKKLTMMQFGNFLYGYGENIVADAVGNAFANTSPLDLVRRKNVCNSVLYHFAKTDSLHDLPACIYQVLTANGLTQKYFGIIPAKYPEII